MYFPTKTIDDISFVSNSTGHQKSRSGKADYINARSHKRNLRCSPWSVLRQTQIFCPYVCMSFLVFCIRHKRTFISSLTSQEEFPNRETVINNKIPHVNNGSISMLSTTIEECANCHTISKNPKFQERHTMMRYEVNRFQIFSNSLLAVCTPPHSSLVFHSTLFRSAPKLSLVEKVFKSTTTSRDRRTKVFLFPCLGSIRTTTTHTRTSTPASNNNPNKQRSHGIPCQSTTPYRPDRTEKLVRADVDRVVVSTQIHQCRDYASENRTR